MSRTLIILFVLLYPIAAFAQQHSIYADLGYTPGFSVTYNYKLAKRLGAGAGVHVYRIHRTWQDGVDFTPALYGNIRLNIRPEKKGQLFLMLDVGMNFYKQDKSYHRESTYLFNIPNNNGIYTGLALGYMRRMTKRGGGPYVSLKPMVNWFSMRRYYIDEDRESAWIGGGGNVALNFGFKF